MKWLRSLFIDAVIAVLIVLAFATLVVVLGIVLGIAVPLLACWAAGKTIVLTLDLIAWCWGWAVYCLMPRQRVYFVKGECPPDVEAALYRIPGFWNETIQLEYKVLPQADGTYTLFFATLESWMAEQVTELLAHWQRRPLISPAPVTSQTPQVQL